MAECVHIVEREVAIQWEERGPLMVVGRDGTVGEAFTPPFDSYPLLADIADVENREAAARGAVLDEVARRARSRGLAESTIRALTEETP